MPSQLKNLEVREVSFVTAPANPGARILFYKSAAPPPILKLVEDGGVFARADGQLLQRKGAAWVALAKDAAAAQPYWKTDTARFAGIDKTAALDDGAFPIKDAGDIAKAIAQIGLAKDAGAAVAHISAMASKLSKADLIPASWADFVQTQKAFDDDQLTVKATEAATALAKSFEGIAIDKGEADRESAKSESLKQFAEYVKGTFPDGFANPALIKAMAMFGFEIGADGVVFKGEVPMTIAADIRKALGLKDDATDAEVMKAITGTAKGELDKLNAELALAKSLGELNDSERGFIAKMSPEDKKRFAGMSPADRKKEMDDCNKSDESLTMADGTSVKKSAVGDAVFAVLKGQQTTLAKQAEEIAKERDQRERGEVVKMATTDLRFIGKADEVGGLIHSVTKGDATSGKALTDLLKALNARLEKGGDSPLFNEQGSGRAGVSKALDAINAQAQELISNMAKAGKTITLAKARDQIRQANPELRKQEETEAIAAQSAVNRRAA